MRLYSDKRLATFGLCATLFLLSHCSCSSNSSVSDSTPLTSPAYLLIGQNVADGFSKNALVIFDAATMTIHHRQELPHSWAKHLSRDPQGRIWIEFSGSLQKDDDRVQVYTPEGALVKTLKVCRNPNAGISFNADRAFVACAEDGFFGSFSIVNLQTLEVEKNLEIRAANDSPLTLVASAATNEAVVATGLVNGPEHNASYSLLTVLDPHELNIKAQLPLGKNTDVWRILPHDGRFYLLNVGSYNQPREQANDLLVFTPGASPEVKPQPLAASPLWGAVHGNALYAVHNPSWNSTVSDSHRQLSRLDLESGAVQLWNLPDDWDASDLNIIEGKIMLTHWEPKGGEDGLYEFNPESGQLSLRLRLDDASSVLAPP